MSDRVSQYGFYDFRLFYVYCMMNEHNNHMNTSSDDYHTINNSVTVNTIYEDTSAYFQKH